MGEYDSQAAQVATQMVSVEELFLDPLNPRLEPSSTERTQEELVEILWRDFAVDEVALSIAYNGYLPFEPLFATTENDRLIVVEGNRRLAAVKLLLDDNLRAELRATDLPQLTDEQKDKLRTIPVTHVKGRQDVWQYLGYKHVNGPQVWQSLAKARYIAKIRNDFGVPLEDIAKNIGDRHATVQRLYRAEAALQQAQQAGVYSVDDRWNKRFAFSHLYTGLDYTGISSFVGLADDESAFESPEPIPPEKLGAFSELCVWLWGSREQGKPPLIRSQNPDLRVLDEVLSTADGTAALRSGLPLAVAVEIGKGDTKILREVLVTAKQSLQEARGKVLTGYSGEEDLFVTAKDSEKLAGGLVQDMVAIRKPPPPEDN